MEAGRDELARFFETVMPHMNEVQRRVVAGAMAVGLGRGGKSAVAAASGMSRNTVIKAQREVETGIEPSTRLRAVGGGEIRAEDKQPGLLVALDELINPDTQGNPMSLLRWTSKSMAKLAAELVRQGFKVTDDTVGRILKDLGYSLQAPSKQKEGAAHPDRDAQFVDLGSLVRSFVGDDGVYDIANDEGWVSVGNSADTATFAVEAIRQWWTNMGQPRFADANRLLITADAGGSNGYRIRLWEVELAKLPRRPDSRSPWPTTPPGRRNGTG